MVVISGNRSSQRPSLAGRLSQSVARRLSLAHPSVEQRAGTVAATTINSLCSVIGAGVLSLPLAMYYSSITVGVALLLIFSIAAAFSVYCLAVGCEATGRYSITEVVAFALFPSLTWDQYVERQGSHAVSAPPVSSDRLGAAVEPGSPPESSAEVVSGILDIAALRLHYSNREHQQRQWRRIMTILVELVVFCSNYGTLIIYTKVIADSIPPVMSAMFHVEGFLVTRTFWICAAGLVFFALSCARHMEELKWTSLIGFLTIFYVVVCIAYRYATSRWQGYPDVPSKARGTIHWISFSSAILQTASTYGLAFSYHFNVPYFYKELQDRTPRVMMQSVAVAFPIIVLCYGVTGVFGYLTFGDLVKSRKAGGNIVSNYDDSDILINIGRLGLFAHFACVFPVVSICTRRGLHRLMMIGLTWQEQSELMQEAAKMSAMQTTNDSVVGSPLSYGGAGALQHTSAREDSPLLREVRAGYEALPAASGAAMHAGRMSYRSHRNDGSFSPVLVDSGAEHLTADVDRDVGSPDHTSFFAIVLEAAVLVCTSVFLAATVSGIDFVIHIIGTCFSVCIVAVAPGLVGWCVFSPNGPFSADAMRHPVDDAAGAAVSGGAERGSLTAPTMVALSSRYRFIRLKRGMSLCNIVLGVGLTGIGVCILLRDAVRGITPLPPV